MQQIPVGLPVNSIGYEGGMRGDKGRGKTKRDPFVLKAFRKIGGGGA